MVKQAADVCSSGEEGVERLANVPDADEFGAIRIARTDIVVHIGGGKDDARKAHLLGLTDA